MERRLKFGLDKKDIEKIVKESPISVIKKKTKG